MTGSFWAWYGKAPLAIRASFALLVTLAFLLVPAPLDHWTFIHAYRPDLYDLDWARMLRLVGWWPTWVLAALALWLHRRELDAALARRQALLLALSPAASALLCATHSPGSPAVQTAAPASTRTSPVVGWTIWLTAYICGCRASGSTLTVS